MFIIRDCFVIISCLFAISSISGFNLNKKHAKLNTHVVTRAISTSSRGGDLSMRWGLKTKEGATANKITGDLDDGQALRDTVPFELRGFSLPLVVFSAGFILTASSFAGFFLNDGGSDGAVSSLGFVYGIPVFLIGLSLWYAEIQPAELITSPAGDAAWEKYSTKTFNEIKQDVTRHRYGDDAHLDSTLESLGLKLPQKKFPKLQTITQEAARDGTQLAFTLTFQSAETPFKVWNDPERVRRYSKFFGPNVFAEVEKVSAEERLVALKLTTIPEEEYTALIKSPIPEKVSKVKEVDEVDDSIDTASADDSAKVGIV